MTMHIICRRIHLEHAVYLHVSTFVKQTSSGKEATEHLLTDDSLMV